MNFKKKILKIFFYNILFILIILLIYEFLFGNWFTNKNFGNLFLPLNKSLIVNKLPYETNDPVIYTTDSNGFRNNKHDLKSIEILVIGGSTTEEKIIDDNKIWTRILEINTNKKVLNAGIGGQTSFGHVKMFDIWFSRFKDLKPNYTLFYIGINDALFMIENITLKNYDNFIDKRVMNSIDRDSLVHVNKIDRIHQYIKNNSALIQLFKFIKGNLIAYKYKINYNLDFTISNKDISKKKFILSDKDKKKITIYKKFYIDNLYKLLEKTRNINSQPIFITQSISSKHWLNEFLIEINNYTKNFCLEKKLKCIYLADDLNLNDTDFYDGIHTNPTGSEKIGVFLSNYFNN